MYEEDELDGEEELSKILKAMKNENLELERRLMVSERECKHLQARAEGLWESLEDAMLDVEMKVEQSCCTTEDTDAMCKRLFGAGMSAGDQL